MLEYTNEAISESGGVKESGGQTKTSNGVVGLGHISWHDLIQIALLTTHMSRIPAKDNPANLERLRNTLMGPIRVGAHQIVLQRSWSG
jgi:hypothetical protein